MFKKFVSDLLCMTLGMLIMSVALLQVSTVNAEASSNIKVGDYVQFDSCFGSPIPWKCVDKSNGIILVFKYILCMKAFDAVESGDRFISTKSDTKPQRYGSLCRNLFAFV